MPYTGKRFYSGLACLLTILILVVTFYIYQYKHRNYTLKLAMLPQEELWTIEHSRKMMDKAITPEHPSIDDEQAMLQLIIHAWQWDKNAMIRYVDIQFEIHGDPILDDFIEKHCHLIVDKHGQQLKKPEILDLDYDHFIPLFADQHYPLAAKFATWLIFGKTGRTDTLHNPLTTTDRKKIIAYTRDAIKGGMRDHLYLASVFLFENGHLYRDSDFTQIHTLKDIIPSASQDELKASLDAYKISALHGSLYAQVKMSEFYYYGVGINQDIEQAWAWSLIASDNFIKFIKSNPHYYYKTNSPESTIDKFNKTSLQKEILENSTKQQIINGEALAKKLQPNCYQDDFRIWAAGIEDVTPQP